MKAVTVSNIQKEMLMTTEVKQEIEDVQIPKEIPFKRKSSFRSSNRLEPSSNLPPPLPF